MEVCSGYTNTGVTEDGKINLRAVQHDTDDFGCGGKRLNTSYKTVDGVAFVLNETTLTPAEGGGHTETLEYDFNGDLSLYNAASVNYFVDEVPMGSFAPIPALLATDDGTLVAIDNSYTGFYNSAAIRDNKGVALVGEEMSFEKKATKLYIYYRMDTAVEGSQTGLCLIVELFVM